jgi:hypothetical protein
MTFNEQVEKIKENWLLVFIALVLFMLPSMLSGVSSVSRYGISSAESYYSGSAYKMGNSLAPSPYYDNRDFAPNQENRKVVKTTTLATEIERGRFIEEAAKLKSIITSSGSFLLSENVNKIGSEMSYYNVGEYSIKVEVTKYDAVVDQIKSIGKIKSFVQNKEDITGQYQKAEIELATEKSRLERYNSMYKEATLVADKIVLNDRIFEQERTIKYMEDNIKNMDKTVDYSTVYFTITEKQSEYANIVFVKLSELISSFVESLNSMARLLFIVMPWVVLFCGILLVFRLRNFRKK